MLDPSAGPASPTTRAAPRAGEVKLGSAPAYVALAVKDVTVRSRSGGKGDIVAVFPQALPWGSPTPFLISEARRTAAGDTYLKVLLPRRPNGSSGWVQRDQVRIKPVTHEVVVDLSSRTASLLRNRRKVRSFRVGVGTAGTPTPTGRFYVTVKLRPPQISAAPTAPGRWGCPATPRSTRPSAPATARSPCTGPTSRRAARPAGVQRVRAHGQRDHQPPGRDAAPWHPGHDPGMTPLRLKAVVKGEVQGVGFRWAVQRQAGQLGLTGYAENLPDGTVRVEAEGDPDRLDQLEAFLHQGPRWAEVASLDSERVPATGEFHRFEARVRRRFRLDGLAWRLHTDVL